MLVKPVAGAQYEGQIITCDQPGGGEIVGNDNPWVVGASAAKSSEDLADNVSHPLHGTLDNLQPASGGIDTNDEPVYIGENSEMPGRHWNGLIDDVRIYNHALNEGDIAKLYNEGR